jgi:hypothetical protein
LKLAMKTKMPSEVRGSPSVQPGVLCKKKPRCGVPFASRASVLWVITPRTTTVWPSPPPESGANGERSVAPFSESSV